MKTLLRWTVLSILLVAILTLGGICVVAFYDRLLNISDPSLMESGIRTGFAAWLILMVGKLFAISGKKKAQPTAV